MFLSILSNTLSVQLNIAAPALLLILIISVNLLIDYIIGVNLQIDY